MTDFAQDLLRDEEEPEPLPPAAHHATETARTVPAVPFTDRRRVTAERVAAAAARTTAPADPAARTGRDASAARREREPEEPGPRGAAGRRRAGQGRGAAGHPEVDEVVGRSAPDRDPDRRAALLAATLTALAVAPERADVDALLLAYADAPSVEVQQAARAVTAVFLRAPAPLRRPLRAALAPAVRRHRGNPLADLLAARLAGGAMPSAAAAAAPSEVPAPEERPRANPEAGHQP